MAVLACGALFAAGLALAGAATVSLTATGPKPGTVTIDWGDTVVFTNVDTVERAVTSQRGAFSSGPISPGASFEHRFDGRPGRYGFVQSGSRPNTSGVVELAPSGTVSLAIRPGTAVYGAAVTVSGRSSYPGTPVVIQVRQAGSGSDWKDLVSLVASDTGTYSAGIKAVAGGRLRARVAAGAITSDLARLDVKPRLSVSARPQRARAGARVVVTGLVVPAGAASSADLEVYQSDRKAWVRVSSRRVAASGKVAFSLRVARGRTPVRMVLRRGSLGAGFVPATSRPLVVVGT
jgi:hypothetical protein